MDHSPITPGSPSIELKAKDCKKFDICNAPICPMDDQSIRLSLWFPFEEICKLREFSKETWLINQKKLQKKVRNRDFCFTHTMLCRNCIITAATQGIDPDHDHADLEKDVSKWIDEHPEKRRLTCEEREIRKNRLPRQQKVSFPFEKEQSAAENEI